MPSISEENVGGINYDGITSMDIKTTAVDLQSTEDPCAELTIVEAEVASVSATLAGLVQKVHIIKARMNELYSPFVRLLPPEIVSVIFAFYLPQFPVGDDIPSTKETYAPLLLGAVCSSWRDIAWGTPALWTNLSLHLTSMLKVSVQIPLIEQWLSRSGHLPLSIHLSSLADMSWVGATFEGILGTINKHSTRWCNLDIRLPSPCYKYLPVGDDANSFPLLQSITLKPPGGQSDREHRVNIFSTPQLRRLTLSCLYLRSIVFQWEVVTTLDLESFYVDETLGMLQETTAVVHLTLRRILGGDDRHTLPDTCILLPSLEEVVVINDKGTELHGFFNKISTPKLHTLSYTGEGLLSIPAAEIVALITRSGSSMETLCVSQASIREDALLALIAVTPALKTLTLVMPVVRTIRHAPLTDKMLEMCNPESAAANNLTCHLPELESFTYSGAQGFGWNTLLKLVDARTPLLIGQGSGQATSEPLSSATRKAPVSSIRDIHVDVTFLLRIEDLHYYDNTLDVSLTESYRARGVNLSLSTARRI
ncbi:hypothetical protein BDZ97DRAFT_621343 [Flammula alnicola]|nr:hypothetical protein BDZ97DRAFT_621343 [Flammula alnicola]